MTKISFPKRLAAMTKFEGFLKKMFTRTCPRKYSYRVEIIGTESRAFRDVRAWVCGSAVIARVSESWARFECREGRARRGDDDDDDEDQDTESLR